MPPSLITDKITIDDKHKLLGLDHLRALAITLVFLFHYRGFGHPKWESAICTFGWTGVDLFFVLSGFLIAGQLFSKIADGKQISLKEFWIKRVFRIIPAYLTVVLLYSFFPVLREGEKFAPVWRYLTFTLNFGLDRNLYNTFTHAWSLCVEEQFYLVLPALLLLCSFFKVGKKAIIILVALFAAGLLYRMWCWDTLVRAALSTPTGNNTWLKLIYYPTYTRLDGLLVGVSIAGLFTFYPQIKARINNYGNALLLTGLALLVGAYFLCADQSSYDASVYGLPLVAFGYGFAVAGAVCPSCILYKFKSKITAAVATLSYSIYLVHKIMLHVAQMIFSKLGVDVNGTLMFFICIASALTGALLLRYLVEKPFLRMRDRVLKQWKNKKAIKQPELIVV